VKVSGKSESMEEGTREIRLQFGDRITGPAMAQ
jgi:hypothetical protein